jgi:DNA-directed RNA polymerase I, II, and III subunit RPABC1
MEGIDFQKANRIFTIKKNQLKMVERRGYDIEKEKPMFNYTLDNFLDVYIPYSKKQNKSLRAVLSLVYDKKDKKDEKTNKRSDRLFVYFAEEPEKPQLGIEYIIDFITEMDKFKTKNGIIISPRNLSPPARKKLESLLGYNVNVFQENEMMYDPTEHYLVPQHRALGEEEQRNFLQQNNLSISNFKVILNTDMISRYYGFRPGQVIEIKRKNMYDTMVPESLDYRVVEQDVTKLV